MPDRERLQLTLELDSRAEPITGRMRAQGGEARSFTGWLGLAAVLGSVLEGDRRDAKANPDSDREVTGEATPAR
jgi:hypothetical protein